ncbi:hypothetical protein EYF80_036294 [Liparis tanakae]|uniref:Uncharacterized protein n=1 Tax=Liparis tanakae TaxID=230148 RepID=A0A4Z2GJY6_9TELE|nr:hypothetical protein EYF80_036294 [Liparis tanakae]
MRPEKKLKNQHLLGPLLLIIVVVIIVIIIIIIIIFIVIIFIVVIIVVVIIIIVIIIVVIIIIIFIVIIIIILSVDFAREHVLYPVLQLLSSSSSISIHTLSACHRHRGQTHRDMHAARQVARSPGRQVARSSGRQVTHIGNVDDSDLWSEQVHLEGLLPVGDQLKATRGGSHQTCSGKIIGVDPDDAQVGQLLAVRYGPVVEHAHHAVLLQGALVVLVIDVENAVFPVVTRELEALCCRGQRHKAQARQQEQAKGEHDTKSKEESSGACEVPGGRILYIAVLFYHYVWTGPFLGDQLFEG